MWLTILRTVLSNIALALSAYGAGAPLGWFLPGSFSRPERESLRWLGGFGLLGTVLFLIGQFRFTRMVIFSVLALFAVLGGRDALRAAKRDSISASGWRGVPIIPAIIVSAMLLLTGIAGFCEITGDWENDAIVYHLSGPKLWLRERVVRPAPENSLTAFPQTVEVLFGALLALGGQRSPGFSAILILAAFYMVIGSLSVRAGLNHRRAWWVVALVATMPAAYTGGYGCFVDVHYASFILAAARVGLDAKRVREFAGFGLFCGLAMGTKYTGLIAVPLLLYCAALRTLNSDQIRWREVIGNLALALTVGSLVAAPFYLRNWILLGSPVYPPPPALSKLFHVKYMSPEMIRWFYTYMRQRCAGLGRGWGAFLLLPFNLTYHTANFDGAGGIGLAPLALGPFGVIASWRNGFSRALAFLGFALTVSWFLTMQESRYFIPVYAIAAIFAVLGWRYAVSFERRWAPALCRTVIACSMLYGSYMIGQARKDDLHAVFSPSYTALRHHDRIPFVEAFDFLNREPSVRKVLILDVSVPPYYLDKDYLKPFGQWREQVLPEAPDADHVLARVHELGISHVLDVRSEVSGFQVHPGSARLTLVFEGGIQKVYRVL